MKVRGKFRCVSVTHTRHTADPTDAGTREFKFAALYDETLPEDRQYAKYTPSGEIRVLVDNPAVDWKPGHSYYVDITPVDAAPAE